MNRTYTIYDTRLKINGLLEGSEYQFRVTAVNAAGYSQPSDASPYIICKDPTCTKIIFLLHCLNYTEILHNLTVFVKTRKMV